MSSNNIQPPVPPPSPQTVQGLGKEMLGCIGSAPHLYQGMLRYWLMWRLPQIIQVTRATPGLKFYYCASSVESLFRDFVKLILLPDLLVIGQTGPLLDFERLTYQHNLDRPWPEVDSTQGDAGLWAIASKPDRPVPDEILPFLAYVFQPFLPTGRVLFAPLATMLAPPNSLEQSLDGVGSLLKEAMENVRPEKV